MGPHGVERVIKVHYIINKTKTKIRRRLASFEESAIGLSDASGFSILTILVVFIMGIVLGYFLPRGCSKPKVVHVRHGAERLTFSAIPTRKEREDPLNLV